MRMRDLLAVNDVLLLSFRNVFKWFMNLSYVFPHLASLADFSTFCFPKVQVMPIRDMRGWNERVSGLPDI